MGPLSSKTIQYSTYGQRSERAGWLVPFWSVLEDDVTVQNLKFLKARFLGHLVGFFIIVFFCGSAIDNNVTYWENQAGFLVDEQICQNFPNPKAGPSLQSSRSGNFGPQKQPHFASGRIKQSSHLDLKRWKGKQNIFWFSTNIFLTHGRQGGRSCNGASTLRCDLRAEKRL